MGRKKKTTKAFEPCSPGCPGWCLMESGRGTELQRCDDCARFKDDNEARAVARGTLLGTIIGDIPRELRDLAIFLLGDPEAE